uniref:Uncharacterized protein n=1 Tax=Palpitomonas bilix TaxID=652834 RepID=A0A7S3CZY7_9EUKA
MTRSYSYFNGILRDFAVYPTALGGAVALEHYCAGAAFPNPSRCNLSADESWKSGASSFSSFQDATDSQSSYFGQCIASAAQPNRVVDTTASVIAAVLLGGLWTTVVVRLVQYLRVLTVRSGMLKFIKLTTICTVVSTLLNVVGALSMGPLFSYVSQLQILSVFGYCCSELSLPWIAYAGWVMGEAGITVAVITVSGPSTLRIFAVCFSFLFSIVLGVVLPNIDPTSRFNAPTEACVLALAAPMISLIYFKLLEVYPRGSATSCKRKKTVNDENGEGGRKNSGSHDREWDVAFLLPFDGVYENALKRKGSAFLVISGCSIAFFRVFYLTAFAYASVPLYVASILFGVWGVLGASSLLLYSSVIRPVGSTTDVPSPASGHADADWQTWASSISVHSLSSQCMDLLFRRSCAGHDISKMPYRMRARRLQQKTANIIQYTLTSVGCVLMVAGAGAYIGILIQNNFMPGTAVIDTQCGDRWGLSRSKYDFGNNSFAAGVNISEVGDWVQVQCNSNCEGLQNNYFGLGMVKSAGYESCTNESNIIGTGGTFETCQVLLGWNTVYGTKNESVFAQRTSVCRAAGSAGLITSKGGCFRVRALPPPAIDDYLSEPRQGENSIIVGYFNTTPIQLGYSSISSAFELAPSDDFCPFSLRNYSFIAIAVFIIGVRMAGASPFIFYMSLYVSQYFAQVFGESGFYWVTYLLDIKNVDYYVNFVVSTLLVIYLYFVGPRLILQPRRYVGEVQRGLFNDTAQTWTETSDGDDVSYNSLNTMRKKDESVNVLLRVVDTCEDIFFVAGFFLLGYYLQFHVDDLLTDLNLTGSFFSDFVTDFGVSHAVFLLLLVGALLLVGIHLRFHAKRGELLSRLLLSISLLVLIVLTSIIADNSWSLPSFGFHFHHYFVYAIIVPVISAPPNPFTKAAAGLLLGASLQGCAQWGSVSVNMESYPSYY